MNKLTINFVCSNLIKDGILDIALTFWLALLPQRALQKQAYYHF